MADMFSGAKVLVAGGTGFVGVNLIQRLLSLGADVRATVHLKEPVLQDPRIEYLKCDLTGMEDCQKAVRDMEYVFMCAANTSGAAVMKATPLVHVTPNLLMNSQLLEAAYFEKVKKFVWISSSAAYPPTDDRPVTEKELFDGDPYEAYFPVGWMKRYIEVLCRMYSEKLADPMTTVVLRPSNMYGPYDDFDPDTSHMVSALIKKVVERNDPLEVWGTGDDIRDLIYIDDFVDAMVLAAEKIDSYLPLNIAVGNGYSVKQVLQTMLEADGFTGAKVVFNSSQPSTIPVRLVDTALAEKVLGQRGPSSNDQMMPSSRPTLRSQELKAAYDDLDLASIGGRPAAEKPQVYVDPFLAGFGDPGVGVPGAGRSPVVFEALKRDRIPPPCESVDSGGSSRLVESPDMVRRSGGL
ncbi:MAG: NAD-dependent epimerase/dehydratase family protein, partial [Nitrospinae bacterium]|nr:NAD-dependent epimerase/dehydratase family protein [Nitrospinota bacterium]